VKEPSPLSFAPEAISVLALKVPCIRMSHWLEKSHAVPVLGWVAEVVSARPPRTTDAGTPKGQGGGNHSGSAPYNRLHYRRGSRRSGSTRLTHWDSYFFPLDAVDNWNRMYGRRGFIQHQCVIPKATARPALGEILDRVSHGGNRAFLGVLKRLGDSAGLIAFPLEGFTLSLDVPVSDRVFPLLDELDRIVVNAGGRLYLAKDATQSAATFEAGYPRLAEFRYLRRAIGAEGRIASRLSNRLSI
jgi:decaprenylphospho-beta-D-ribofuranose 2-oxidase